MRGKVAVPVLLLLLVSATLLGGCEKNDDSTYDDGPPFPETQPLSAEDTKRLHEIRDTVAELRGLKVDREVNEGLIGREALRAYFEEAYSEDEAEGQSKREAWNIAYRMLRMIGPADDLKDIGEESYSTQVVGMFLPKEERLVLVGDTITGSILEEATIAHEYTHSLQHEAFDIEEFRRKDRDDPYAEYGNTLSCVVEGDAVVTEYLYLEEVYGEDWFLEAFEDEDVGLELVEPLEGDEVEIPEAMLRYFYFNYSECFSFVQEIWAEDGWDGVNRLYKEPPATTEQILHVERYLKGERPQEIDPPDLTETLGLAWTQLEGGVFGEFDAYNYLLTAGLSVSAAANAAEGWGGGQMRIYSLGSDDQQEVMLHIILGWDTSGDYRQFRNAFDAAISRLKYEDRSSAGSVWQWQSPREYGLAMWDEAERRVDILMSTNQEALDRVQASLGESATAK